MKIKIYVKQDYAVIEYDSFLSREEKSDLTRQLKEENKNVNIVFFRHLRDKRYKTTKN